MLGKQVPVENRLVFFPNGKYVDFTELWSGASDVRPDRVGRSWNGGFSGRPHLASQLWPALLAQCVVHDLYTCRTNSTALRAFFRFLDAYERQFDCRIENLAEVTEAVGYIWLQPFRSAWARPRGEYFRFIGRLLRLARQRVLGELGRFEWPLFPVPDKIDWHDIPDELQARAALNLLKREAQAIYRRWAQADRLAAMGRNLLLEARKGRGFGSRVLEADLHATYRALIHASGNPLPTVEDVRHAFGHTRAHGLPSFWERSGFSLSDIQGGLYPFLDDISCLSQLFMARTGWNLSTVYRLDITNEHWASPYGDPEHGLWVIESWKNRSHDWQQTICRGKTTTGPWHIVKILIDRTEPLRGLLRSNPSRVSKGAVVEAGLTSPWIGAGQSCAMGKVVIAASQSSVPTIYWRKRVTAYNAGAAAANTTIDATNAEIARENAELQPSEQRRYVQRMSLIPVSMTPSDWRDVYANFVFIDSRYSWVMVQWALGHKHVRTTRDYLRTRLWRQYSEKKLVELQTVMFDEMRHARLDVVVLRARVDLGIVPSDEDRKRLENHRKVIHERELTESGYQCQSPFYPPPEIDVENPSNGTMRCRRGERCPGCPAAIAVDGFHMVKRLVELELLRSKVSATVWMESQLAGDLEVLRNDLEQWPREEVARYRRFWEEEFESGRRRLNPWSSLN